MAPVVVDGDTTATGSGLRLLRFDRRGDFGKLVVMLALLTLNQPELAARRNGVGNDRKIRCEYGSEVAGSSCCVPMADSWDGGIHGARRWMRPRICCGIRRAVASA